MISFYSSSMLSHVLLLCPSSEIFFFSLIRVFIIYWSDTDDDDYYYDYVEFVSSYTYINIIYPIHSLVSSVISVCLWCNITTQIFAQLLFIMSFSLCFIYISRLEIRKKINVYNDLICTLHTNQSFNEIDVRYYECVCVCVFICLRNDWK